ncbi:MAG: sigma factor-like helix-turn-helix DNA-binding protein [Paeniclostridium sordellii]|nr:sigma factor-like helix-turn-helix DNA-binding protein [Paeniclostridium sordellii]
MTDYNKVEELLEEYANLDIEIKGLEYQIKIEGVRGISYNDMPGSPLPSNKSPIENELNKIRKLKDDKLYLEIKKEAIDNMLRILDESEHKLIILKYIKKLSNQQIASQMHMHENSISNKKKNILIKLYPYAMKHKLIKS